MAGARLGETAIRQVGEVVRIVAGRFPDQFRHRGRWHSPREGGGGTYTVSFEVTDWPECPGPATAQIISRSPTTARTVPDEVMGVITVYDVHGCHLQGPVENVVGKKGSATYRRPDGGASDGSDDRWEIDFLCCESDCS